MQIERYLRRIDYDGPLTIDATTLEALHRAHLRTVPFENLSIGWGEPIVIDVAQHFDKIVERRRGGFCYEQNHLFAWALDTIGFEVGLRGAAVATTRDGLCRYGDPASHLLTHVMLDGEPWIADVGFGENFRAPLRLIDGLVQEQSFDAYRLALADGGGVARWTLSTRNPRSAWEETYRFVDRAPPMTELARMCRFHQTSPESPFTQKRLCSLAVPYGRVTLSGNEWIVTSLDGVRDVTPIGDEAEAVRLLKRHFGIDVPRHESRQP